MFPSVLARCELDLNSPFVDFRFPNLLMNLLLFEIYLNPLQTCLILFEDELAFSDFTVNFSVSLFDLALELYFRILTCWDIVLSIILLYFR